MAREIIVRFVGDTKQLTADIESASRKLQSAATARESGEERHQRKLVEIQQRAISQIDVIRARSAAREIEHQQKIQREAQRTANAYELVRSSIGKLTTALGVLGGAAAFTKIAQFGIDLDRSRNQLVALTGSAEKAKQRFSELNAIAQRTPGLTTGLATTLDAQLRVFSVNVATIDRLLPVIGKLNAISPLGDPRQFVNNLTQLVSQNFERQDLKELVGQSPIAGQLIKQIFNVDNPTNAEAIRKAAKAMGVTTVERLAEELIKAAENSAALKNAQESLGDRLEKRFEQLKIRLGETGEKILETLIPALDKLLPLLNGMLGVFNKLPDNLQATTIGILAVAPAINTLVGAVSGLKAAMVSLGAFAVTPAGIAALGLVGIATAGFALNDLVKNQIPANVSSALNPQGLTPDPSGKFALIPGRETTLGGLGGAQAQSQVIAQTKKTARLGTGAGRLATSRDATKRAHEIADLIKKVADAREVADQTLIQGLEEVERTITGGVIQTNRQVADAEALRAGRPAQLAGFSAANAERLRQIDLESARLEQNTAKKAAEEIAKIPQILSNSERFMRSFAEATLSVGDAFDRFGANVANAFTNVRSLFEGLKRAVFDFFNDLLGSALQNLVRGTLGGIFGQLGGIFGGAAGGNIFRTPNFVGNALAAASSGFAAAPSISSFGPIGFGQGFGILPGASGGGNILHEGAHALTAGLPPKFSLSGLGKGLAGAAPFLGLSLGSGLGGQSIAGNILGSAGGFLGGAFLAATVTPGLFSAGAAALFSNPITAIAGAGLLVGSLLLGKAKQRKSDEEASGEMLRQALAAIDQLAAGVASGSIDGSQARAIFDNQILGQFIAQIRTLKTRSVVESRLKNQVQDLRNVFEARIPPLIAQQAAQRGRAAAAAAVDSRLIPEFATGGTTFGGLALLHPGEKVLNLQQQAAVRAMAGPSVFERAGVPGISRNAVFDRGGTMGRGLDVPLEITLDAQIIIGKDDATKIVVTGGRTSSGRAVTVSNVRQAKTNREL